MSTISASTTTTTGFVVTSNTAGTLVLQTGSTPTTAVTIDGSQNVGIGTSSPSLKLDVNGDIQQRNGGGVTVGKVENASGWYSLTGDSANVNGTQMSHGSTLRFLTAGSERARIDSSGNLLVGTTSSSANVTVSDATAGNAYYIGLTMSGVGIASTAKNDSALQLNRQGNADGAIQYFRRNGSIVGSVSVTGSATSYVTSSDYRLKENILPMTSALAAVQQLKPCTYMWKVDGSDGQGFIAHELQEVVPDAVVGEKDAVDADGNPVYQGIDTSFLVATLTAAIQELKAELDAAKADIATLKGAA